MQVAQLEKEKKGMNERLRIIAKRIDHTERANRKEERPLLDKDYEDQQRLDRTTFEAVQYQRKEASKQAHKEDLETKARLKRMMGEYEPWKQVLVEKKGDSYKKKVEAADKKIEQEKAKRKAAVVKAWEEENAQREKEEAEVRAREEEEREQEEGELFLKYSTSYFFNLIYFLQLVLQKKSASTEKKKSDLPLTRLLVRRKKTKRLLNVRYVRRSDRKLWKRRVSSNNEKTKQKNADDNAVQRRKKRSLPTGSLVRCVDRRLFVLQMDKNLLGGGVFLGLVWPGRQRNRRADLKVPRRLLPHQPGINRVVWVVFHGENAKRPRLQPRPQVVPHRRVLHRLLYHPRKTSQRRRRMDSRP